MKVIIFVRYGVISDRVLSYFITCKVSSSSFHSPLIKRNEMSNAFRKNFISSRLADSAGRILATKLFSGELKFLAKRNVGMSVGIYDHEMGIRV